MAFRTPILLRLLLDLVIFGGVDLIGIIALKLSIILEQKHSRFVKALHSFTSCERYPHPMRHIPKNLFK